MKVEALIQLIDKYHESQPGYEDVGEELFSFWEHFYYGDEKELEDGSIEWKNKDPIALADGVTASYVDDEEFLRHGERVLRVIVDVNGYTFACEGWYDSWNGDAGFEGPVYKVLPEEVVTRTWRKVE